MITAQALIEAALAAIAETTQYICAAGTRTIIDKFTGTNTDAAAQTITVKIVPSGGAIGAGNTIVKTKTLAPGECYTFPELVGHVLNPGDFISTLTSANVIAIRSSGRVVN